MRTYTLASLLLTLFIYGCSGGGGGSTPQEKAPGGDTSASAPVPVLPTYTKGRVISHMITTGAQSTSGSASEPECRFTASYTANDGAMLQYVYFGKGETSDDFEACMQLTVGAEVDVPSN